VDPRQLRHFLALVEERSFTRAAAREFIVQSGLSSSIRSLEAELSVELYIRGTRPVRLTAEGEALVGPARYALEALSATYQAVNAVTSRLSGHLRMGVFQNIGHLIPLSSVLAKFVEDYPEIDLSLRQLPSTEMVDMVSSGELDCALVNGLTEKTKGVEVTALAEEPLELVASTGSPLSRQGAISFRDLDGAKFVETASGFATRRLTDLAFATAGFHRRIVCEASGWPMVVDLVEAGLGIAFLPQGIADTSPGLTALTVLDLSLARRIDFATPSGRAASPATREMSSRLHAATHLP
jgi:DNA-binding transcriptional LysR family regulator